MAFRVLVKFIGVCQGLLSRPRIGVVLLGDVAGGERVTAEFQLRNLSGHTVHVIGAQSDCGCVAWQSLPIEVPPHATATMSAYFTPPVISTAEDADVKEELAFLNDTDVGTVRHPIRLFLDVDSPLVVVTLEGKVISAPTPDLSEPELAEGI